MKNKSPNLYVIAGPNGAGKTTFATKFLPKYAKCPYFVNADLIAKGISPFSPEKVPIKAGKILLNEIKELVRQKKSFGFETTLSGKTYFSLFQNAKDKGYKIHIFFLWIPNSKLAIARIKNRVKKGGHHIPSEDVKRRFSRSIHNFFKMYGPLAETWHLFDNSSETPNLIAKLLKKEVIVKKQEMYDKINQKSL